MNYITNIILFAFITQIILSCSNENPSEKPHSQTTNYDTIEKINDWYIDADNNIKKIQVVRLNGKIGFIYEDGQVLFPCIFDSVVDVDNDAIGIVNGKYVQTAKGYFATYAKVKKNGKWGLISTDGKVILSYDYEDIYSFDYHKTDRMEGPYIEFVDNNGNLAIVEKNSKWGLVTTTGAVVAECIYEQFYVSDVQLFYENRAAAKKDGLWGFLNEKGQPVTAFMYESVGSQLLESPQSFSIFKEGIAVVKKNGKWGAIDLNGKVALPFEYDYISTFDTDTTAAKKNGNWGYINKKGAEIIPIIYDEIKWLELGMCPAKKDGLWRFLDSKGDVSVSTGYDDILICKEVAVDAGLWFYSQDGYCAVKNKGKWGLIDSKQNKVLNFEYDSIKFTSSGLNDWCYISAGFVSVKKGKFWSVVNVNGLNHIPFEYDDVSIWSEGNICVKKNGKWGLLDSLGKQLVAIQYDNEMDAGNSKYAQENK